MIRRFFMAIAYALGFARRTSLPMVPEEFIEPESPYGLDRVAVHHFAQSAPRFNQRKTRKRIRQMGGKR